MECGRTKKYIREEAQSGFGASWLDQAAFAITSGIHSADFSNQRLYGLVPRSPSGCPPGHAKLGSKHRASIAMVCRSKLTESPRVSVPSAWVIAADPDNPSGLSNHDQKG